MQSLYHSIELLVRNFFLIAYREEGIDEDTLFDIQFKQLQITWSKIFGDLSKLAFDKCMKFMMSSLL